MIHWSADLLGLGFESRNGRHFLFFSVLTKRGLQISNRDWVCPECRTHHDRDINAAQNIKMIGLRAIMTPGEPREGPVELSAVAEALKQET